MKGTNPIQKIRVKQKKKQRSSRDWSDDYKFISHIRGGCDGWKTAELFFRRSTSSRGVSGLSLLRQAFEKKSILFSDTTDELVGDQDEGAMALLKNVFSKQSDSTISFRDDADLIDFFDQMGIDINDRAFDGIQNIYESGNPKTVIWYLTRHDKVMDMIEKGFIDVSKIEASILSGALNHHLNK